MSRAGCAAITGAALGALVWWTAGVSGQTPSRAATRARPSSPAVATRPVASVKDVMTAILDPAADQVWAAVTVVESASGVEERMPRTEEEWAKVRGYAIAIAESGNLLALPGRAVDEGPWLAFSRALVDTGERAVRAAERKDTAALLDAGEQIYAACTQCHFVYWQPPPPEPPAPLPPPIRR